VSGPLAPRPPVARRSRTDTLALLAAEEAVGMAGCAESIDRRRAAVVIGSTCGGFREIEKTCLERAAGRPVSSARLLVLEKANAADLVAARFGFLGPRFTVHTACASGATAILIGAELIRAGAADAALVGGSDALARLTLSGFRSLRLIDPAACRPFDKNRRGLSLGEGAGMLVLEPAGPAGRRGARPLAVLLGGAHSVDAHHLTAPAADGSGAARAIRAALHEARLAPGDVDHINAHGTGTQANDAAEAAAIAAALGGRAARCPVTSIKGSIGHTLGAAGAIEAIATIQTLRTGLIPPTAGLAEPDPAFALDLVRGAPRPGTYRAALSHSFGFGGANAVLCFGTVAT
jgi:3-oxoacyl-[acyl-carrier-protein] synthase II